MEISTKPINQTINYFCKKIENILIYLYFLGFFDANVEAVGLGGILNPASYAIVLFLIILRCKRCIYVFSKDISLLVLIATIILSYFWSASPGYTLDMIKAILRTILFGVYLAAQYNPKDLMRLFVWMFAFALVVNWGFACFAIATGQSDLAIAQTNNEPSWKAFATHKQLLGRMMMHGCVIFLLSALSNKRFRWLKLVGLGLSGILLLLSRSKTAWVLFLLSLTLLPILKFVKLGYKYRTVIYLLLVLITGIVAVLFYGNYETILVDVLNKSADFSGRFDIWKAAIESGLKRPLFGYGFGGFWDSSEGFNVVRSTWAGSSIDVFNNSTLFHAHNGFLDIFLQLGIFGLLLFIFNFLAVMKRVINLVHLTQTIESLWMLEFLILWFLFQMTERISFLTTSTLYSMYVAIGISTIVWQNRIQKNGNNY